MEKDIVFETAERYVNDTGRSVFLTGKAGTGKTTFLKYITRTTSKRFVVLAPTGVAAINAGGSTIHSFFLLPLCPYLPDVKELVTEYQMSERYRGFRKDKLKIIRTLDLLIIDEISMVRADLLDAVDMTLRRCRKDERPFGGVQLLMIGDAQQLSPVVRENERQYVSQVYPSPYFFNSKALQKLPYITIELDKVYRQKDAAFLDILNAIRDNRADAGILRRLNSRVGAFDDKGDGEGIIRLTTHNAQADEVNARKLEALEGEAMVFEADIQGDFPENMYPADCRLTLKEGAQVMFIRNDPEGFYYNGKIGKVAGIDDNGTVSVVDETGMEVEVSAVEWCNTQYALDKDSGEIRQDVTGTFRQLPLKIAWAITIHKSQGLTFDKVIINAGAAFAFGQVYVALSRCRSLEGISLDSPIHPGSIYSDLDVAEFNGRIPPAQTVKDALESEERGYRFDQLRELFSFGECCRCAGWVYGIVKNNLADIYPDQVRELASVRDSLDKARQVADTFKVQLTRIQESACPDDGFLEGRLGKAADYFIGCFRQARDFMIDISDLAIDNKETRKSFSEAVGEALVALETVYRSLEAIQEGRFSIDAYHRIRTESQLADFRKPKSRKLKKIERKEGEEGVVNETLRERLMEWRSARFKADNVPAYTILHQSTLLQIAVLIPKTKEELLSVKGFGEAKFRKYGEEILEICKDID
ncbi:MAG: HRDC domain-containing protein [Candidatus Cryptobacteroides sp.]